jgi:hypothetical protein
LAEKPVATFLVCMALAPEKQQRHAKALQSPVVIMRLPGQPPGMSPAAC